MSDTPREDITVADATPRAPKAAPTHAPAASPKIKKDLRQLVNEMGGDVEKLRKYLEGVKPVDYTKGPEEQSESIAGAQSQMMAYIAITTLTLNDADFSKLTFESFREHLSKAGNIAIPQKLEGLKMGNTYQSLSSNSGTPTGQEVLKKWEEMKEIAGLARADLKKQYGTTPFNTSASTLPPVGAVPAEGSTSGSGGGIIEGTKTFIKDNKTSLMIGGAALVGIYAAYKLFGGKGSSDESKWFSGITDWKVLSIAGIATAFGLYKWGPDWIRGAFDKFKSFITSEKTSSIEPAKITDMAKRIVEYNNKKDPENRRTAFPEKLIKSKGGMTMAEFKDKDGFFSNVMYTVNSGVSWLTGTSGALPNDMKQEWKDYQLLLAYTKDKVGEYKIEATDDTKMDDVWKKIMEKEGGK